MSHKAGVWTNGSKRVTGWWLYNYSSDSFTICINKNNTLTGEKYQYINTKNDTPEWGKWKLERT